MPGVLPDGEPVPATGELPATALARAGERGFGVYVHIPFCASRCGYCDFNTYTAAELAGGVTRESYADLVLAEIALSKRVLDGVKAPVETVFFGGGTPTLLPAADLGRILHAVDDAFGLAPGAEVTTEANPESVDPAYLRELRAAGFTRVSLGMQSAARHVLAILDRKHTPGRAVEAAREAREAGFEHVNLDLIYSTPGETAADWDASLTAAIGAGVDHVSAYSLIVEDGTRLAGRVRRGELAVPDDDVAADRYLAADAALSAAGLGWYEVSNWAASEAARCRHNLLYWRGGDWWGYGPGAHSHVGGVRWWNARHPSAYAARLAEGASPGHGRELLSAEDEYIEDVLLRIRLAEGLPVSSLRAPGRHAATLAAADGLLDSAALADGRAVLTLRGRLLADAVVRDLLP
ncbi:coproporphyrinogen III oxidase [Actinorhabdospora filicis]|uniref:Heme chaperone HemW n=1 Tax=Actinorhabdospora filicis TaxID=1785913 RepID=A0A9W6WA70_9ACTN|nr:coproporphyrinogen III oxidase [Actinorhabdospora filicis]